MIRKTLEGGKPVINLDGQDGNAFYLLGIAKKFGAELGYDSEYIKDKIAEMMSGDYENLVRIFDRWLGDVVILETDNENLLSNTSDVNGERLRGLVLERSIGHE